MNAHWAATPHAEVTLRRLAVAITSGVVILTLGAVQWQLPCPDVSSTTTCHVDGCEAANGAIGASTWMLVSVWARSTPGLAGAGSCLPLVMLPGKEGVEMAMAINERRLGYVWQ